MGIPFKAVCSHVGAPTRMPGGGRLRSTQAAEKRPQPVIPSNTRSDFRASMGALEILESRRLWCQRTTANFAPRRYGIATLDGHSAGLKGQRCKSIQAGIGWRPGLDMSPTFRPASAGRKAGARIKPEPSRAIGLSFKLHNSKGKAMYTEGEGV